MIAYQTAAGILLTTVLCVTRAPAQFGPATALEETARIVQCDGFLLEWPEDRAQQFGSSDLLWSAVQTPDGVAGYVRVPSTSNCLISEVLFVREDEVDSISLPVADRGASCCPFHAVQFDSVRGETVVEFLLTWQRLGSTAQAGQYRLRLEVLGSGGAQCALTTFTGPEESLATLVLTPALKRQLGVVAVLLVLYVGLMLWVRKMRTRRTQSPHQSA